MSLLRSFTTQLKVAEKPQEPQEPQYVLTAKASKNDRPSRANLVASSRSLNSASSSSSYRESLKRLGSTNLGLKNRIVREKVERGEWTRNQAKQYKEKRNLNHYNVRVNELIVDSDNRGVDDKALERYRNKWGWSVKQVNEYKKLREANEKDTLFNQALRRTRQKHDKNAMELFERKQEVEFMKEARKINAKNFIEQMQRVRVQVKVDTCNKRNYYPNQMRMRTYLQGTLVNVLGLISNTSVSKKQMNLNVGFSKKDLLKAGLLVELNEWIHWPVKCWDARLHPHSAESVAYEYNDSESAYSDTPVPGRKYNNIFLEYLYAKLENTTVSKLNYKRTIYGARFVGFDLGVVQLILQGLVGGIEKRVESSFTRSRLSQPLKSIEYFPFYKFVHKEGSSTVMMFEIDEEKTTAFKMQESKKKGKSYMQWTLNPEDYNASTGKNTQFKIWTDFGGNALLSTLEKIKDADSNPYTRNDEFFAMFPNEIGPKEYGVLKAEADKNSTSYRYKYEWPMMIRGIKPIALLDSRLMSRLKYAVEVWKYNRARYDSAALQIPE